MKTQVNHMTFHHRVMNLFLTFSLAVITVVAITTIVQVYQKSIYPHQFVLPIRPVVANTPVAIAEFHLPEVLIVGHNVNFPTQNTSSVNAGIMPVLHLPEVVIYGKRVGLVASKKQHPIVGKVNAKTHRTMTMPAVSKYLRSDGIEFSEDFIGLESWMTSPDAWFNDTENVQSGTISNANSLAN